MMITMMRRRREKSRSRLGLATNHRPGACRRFPVAGHVGSERINEASADALRMKKQGLRSCTRMHAYARLAPLPETAL
jgi:hypothetical protein